MTIRFLPQAETDLVEARLWYESQRFGLGQEFLDAVERVLKQIEINPEQYRIVYREVRRALTRRFPFAIYYRVHESGVVVLAVIDWRRDPRRWQSRV